MIRHIAFWAFAASSTLLSGCASLIDSKLQSVTVFGECGGHQISGASCNLSNDKGVFYTPVPGTITIPKSYGDLAVACSFGRGQAVTVVRSNATAPVWGNIINGGLIGWAIDANTGAGFDYPNVVTVSFRPPCER
jgi:hypothetical protein